MYGNTRENTIIITSSNVPNATHPPQIAALLIVSKSIPFFRADDTANGASANAAVVKRATAYSDESTPGSAIMSLAAAKFDAQSAQSTATTPRHASPPSRFSVFLDAMSSKEKDGSSLDGSSANEGEEDVFGESIVLVLESKACSSEE